jgi:hypothetical protein
MMPNNSRPALLLLFNNSRCWWFSGVLKTRSVKDKIALMGVRISWLMWARNSVLAALDFSATSRA